VSEFVVPPILFVKRGAILAIVAGLKTGRLRRKRLNAGWNSSILRDGRFSNAREELHLAPSGDELGLDLG